MINVLLGLAILLVAGDALVKGAVNAALRLGVPALLVSLTVVAFGTSAPELLVSVKAALEDHPGIALGNVVGSNIANVLLVLGVPALIFRIRGQGIDTRKSFTIMLVCSLLFIGLAADGELSRLDGGLLAGVLALVLGESYLSLRRQRAGRLARFEEELEEVIEEAEGADPEMPGWVIVAWLVAGLLGLPLGADILVDGAAAIARRAGISEAAIGLTLIALGTSLPELATTVMAAFRRHAEVAMGNVIGSNMFNILGIIGVTALVHPVAVPESFMAGDFWVMLAASLVLFPFVYLGRDLGRRFGIVFVTAYVAYVWALL